MYSKTIQVCIYIYTHIYIYIHNRSLSYACFICVCVCAQMLQSCPPLCDTVDWGLPGSSAHGILQARILEWVVMPSSRRSSQPRDRTRVSCISCIAGRFFTAEPLDVFYIMCRYYSQIPNLSFPRPPPFPFSDHKFFPKWTYLQNHILLSSKKSAVL